MNSARKLSYPIHYEHLQNCKVQLLITGFNPSTYDLSSVIPAAASNSKTIFLKNETFGFIKIKCKERSIAMNVTSRLSCSTALVQHSSRAQKQWQLPTSQPSVLYVVERSKSSTLPAEASNRISASNPSNWSAVKELTESSLLHDHKEFAFSLITYRPLLSRQGQEKRHSSALLGIARLVASPCWTLLRLCYQLLSPAACSHSSTVWADILHPSLIVLIVSGNGFIPLLLGTRLLSTRVPRCLCCTAALSASGIFCLAVIIEQAHLAKK